MKTRQIIEEAIDPKRVFLNQFGHDREMAVLRQLQLHDKPYPDSWKEGQRVARLRDNLSAWAAGEDRGRAGDLGTVRAFVCRRDEPEHSLYLVRWDSYQLSSAYATHATARAVANESARDIIDAIDPKRIFRTIQAQRSPFKLMLDAMNQKAKTRTQAADLAKAWANRKLA